MAYAVRVLPEHRLGLVRLSGDVDGSELLRALRALFALPEWRPGFGAAWDGRGLRSLDVMPEDVEHIAAYTGQLQPRIGVGRTAVLGRGEQDAITVRLLTLRQRNNRVRRVRTFADARGAASWLGVPPDVLEEPRPLLLRSRAPRR